jgi:ATP diphosphatase
VEQSPIDRLREIMARLRADDGCPWDRQQTFETIAPYTIEEAYEVAEAIAHGDMAGLRDELGDLLFQVVFHARMAEEAGEFDFDDAAAAICDKLVRRHPHVFGDAQVDDAEAQTTAWEAHKAAEREAKARAAGRRVSVLDDVALGLPALARAVKLQKRASRVGFDWPDARGVLDKINEEMAELSAELVDRKAAATPDHERIMDEFGDLLFAYVNLARHLDLDPETALRRTNAKFERRFRQIEAWLAETGRTPEQAGLEEMDALWERAKAAEHGGEPRPSPRSAKSP